MNHRDNIYIYNAGLTAYYLDLHFPPSSYWPTVTATLNTAVINNRPVMKFSRIEVVHIGENFPTKQISDISITPSSTTRFSGLSDRVRRLTL